MDQSRPKTLPFSSVQFSHSVVSNSLQTHELQHTRPPCPSLTPGVHSNSCPSSPWCHPAISSSVVPFSSCLQFFPASGSFLCIRWPKYPSFSFNISPSNEYSGLISFRIDWFDLLEVQGTLKSLLEHYSSKSSILQHSAFFIVQLSDPYMTTGKTMALTRWTFVGKVMSLLFNMLYVCHSFSSKEKASSNFMASVTICSDFGALELKSVTVSIASPSICHEVMGPDAIILVFWMLSFKPTFSLSSRVSLVLHFLP